jgi:enoyl-CoA hydratase/carnithine racemase
MQARIDEAIGDAEGLVRASVTDGVATVELTRPDKHNAISYAMWLAFARLMPVLAADDAVSVVVLRGTDGGPFSAGADIGEFRTMRADPAGAEQYGAAVEAGERAIVDFPKPTIAAIEGFAIGGGVALAVACDFRVMGQGAYLRLPEIPLGMNMSWHAVPRLVALGGPAHTKRLTLFGDNLSAEAALAAGFADEIVPDGNALAAAKALARKAAALPPVAARIAKRAITAAASALHGATAYADLDQFALTQGSADAREAVVAFLDKRTPTFTGA